MPKQVLLLEPCDFESAPVGGQLSVAKQMMRAFGPSLALVGMSGDSHSIGRWCRKTTPIGEFDFFPVAELRQRAERPAIPRRIIAYRAFRAHRDAILSIGIRHAITQAPEVLLAVAGWPLESICYVFPGVDNLVANSRYGWARPFYGLYEWWFFRSLQSVDTLLAAADEKSIETMVQRSKGRIASGSVRSFPSCYDDEIFYRRDVAVAREALGLLGSGPVVVTTGRLNCVKGWPLLIESFQYIQVNAPHAKLIFVGDGEDKAQIETMIAERGLSCHVRVVGFQPPDAVATYLNAADLFVMGSYSEGWSVALLEAMACGKPVVCTEFSGATTMVQNGENGFVVVGRNPKVFANAMEEALRLANASERSIASSEPYAMHWMAQRLGTLWPPLRRLSVS